MIVTQRFGRFLLAIAVAAFSVSASATLVGRDINGYAVAGSDARAMFLYDGDQNITWLRDANAASGSIYENKALAYRGEPGLMRWADAMIWASELTVGSFDDWRLPSINGMCQNDNFACLGGELAHLWYQELGNTGGYNNTDVDTGDFLNFQSGTYWNSDAGWGPDWVWQFQTYSGVQTIYRAGHSRYAIAVRDGDVLVVPEPGMLALLVAALSALSFVRRRN